MTATFRAMASATDHRDADLLDLIEQMQQLTATARRLHEMAIRHRPASRAHRRLWREALASSDDCDRLERAICATKARTPLGAIAKGNLWLELYGDRFGSIMDLPRAAIIEMMAMLDHAATTPAVPRTA